LTCQHHETAKKNYTSGLSSASPFPSQLPQLPGPPSRVSNSTEPLAMILNFSYLKNNHSVNVNISITNSMEQSSSSEVTTFSVSHRNSRIVWSSNVRCRIHKIQPPIPILIQLKPVSASPSHLLKIHFNIIFTSMPSSYKWSLSLRSPHQNPVCNSPVSYTRHMPCPSHSS